jgi:hypothetical protein
MTSKLEKTLKIRPTHLQRGGSFYNVFPEFYKISIRRFLGLQSDSYFLYVSITQIF